MAKHKLTDAVALVGGINVGGGDIDLVGLNAGSVSIDPASIASVTRGVGVATIVGVALGDVVVMIPPAALNDDLLFVGARVTAADTVNVYLYNPTGGAIDDTARSWDYLHFALST